MVENYYFILKVVKKAYSNVTISQLVLIINDVL